MKVTATVVILGMIIGCAVAVTEKPFRLPRNDPDKVDMITPQSDDKLVKQMQMDMSKMQETIKSLRGRVNSLRAKRGLPAETAPSFEVDEGEDHAGPSVHATRAQASNPAPSSVNEGDKYMVPDSPAMEKLEEDADTLVASSGQDGHIDSKYQWAGTPDDFRITGHFIRRLTHYTQYQMHTSQSYGWLNGRRIVFNKVHGGSGLRIVWTDNFRTYRSGHSCQWNIYVNGKHCNHGRFAKYDGSGVYYVNKHGFATFTTTCWGTPAGKAVIQTYVQPSPGYGNYGSCWTGWHTVTNMEVEEVL